MKYGDRPNDCSQTDWEKFCHIVDRTSLDPLANQIYLIKAGRRHMVVTGIDGYRLLADRTGAYLGSTVTYEEGEHHVLSASVTVQKIVQGNVGEFQAVAHWAEYNKRSSTWSQYGHIMLAKCAEALALRKAFPADLSGMHTADEVDSIGEAQQSAPVGPGTLEDVAPVDPRGEAPAPSGESRRRDRLGYTEEQNRWLAENSQISGFLDAVQEEEAKGGPVASEKQYGFLASTIDRLLNDMAPDGKKFGVQHKEVLTFILNREVSKDAPPLKGVCTRLLKRLVAYPRNLRRGNNDTPSQDYSPQAEEIIQQIGDKLLSDDLWQGNS